MCEGTSPTHLPQLLLALRRATFLSFRWVSLVAMAAPCMAEVMTATDTLRAAVAAGEDVSERQVVRAINSSPGAVVSAAATKTKERSTGGDAAPVDPYPEPPADPQTMSAAAADDRVSPGPSTRSGSWRPTS